MNGVSSRHPHLQVMLLRPQDIIKLPPSAMDPVPFQPFAAGSTSTMTTTTTTTPNWGLPPNESKSDWTVEILSVAVPDPYTTTTPEQDNSPEDVVSGFSPRLQKKRKTGTVYHVHKDRLAKGPRGSLYFANAFRSKCSTQNNSFTTTTVVTLPPKLAECFPDVLDFVYADDGSNVQVDSPATAVAIRRLASYFGMAVLYGNVNATYISTNLSNETVIDYVIESLRYGDERLYKAAHRFLVQAITNGTLGWTCAMGSLPLRSLLEIAKEMKRNENFGPIVMEYIQHDAGRRVIPPKIVETLLDRLHPSVMQQCPYDILQVMERYHLPADHYLCRVCANIIAKTWQARPHLRGGVAASPAVRRDHAKYTALSDAQKVQILERSMQWAHDGREALGTDVRHAQIQLHSLAAIELKLRFRTMVLEAELARFVRFRHVGVHARGCYDGSNRNMQPIATPKDRQRAAEVIGTVVTQEASGRVGSETLSLYVYKGP
jgi:hypothetical protein